MNSRIGNLALPLVGLLLFSGQIAPVLGQNASESERTLTLFAAIQAEKYLTPGAPSASGSLQVDSMGFASVTFGSFSKTLNITLTDPLGSGVSVRSAGTSTVEPWFSPDPADDDYAETIGATYGFNLTDPMPGAWTYLIEEPASLSETRAVLVSMKSTSPVRAGMLGARRDYLLDDDITLGVVTVEGSQVLMGVSIFGVMMKAGQTVPVGTVTFADNGLDGDGESGDGMFTALIVPESPGDYSVTATITGTRSNGQAFTRIVASSFSVKATIARLLGGFTEQAIGSPQIESIEIAPQIRVVVAGTYRVAVMLKGPNGRFLTSSAVAALEAGDRSIEVTFTGRRILADIGVDGPYTLHTIRLERLQGVDREFLDENINGGETAAYLLSGFAREVILEFNGGLVEPVDSNGNGKYESLDVITQLTLVTATTYSWSAQLQTLTGELVANASGSGDLPDIALPRLVFDGETIAASGLDGPYRVKMFQISGTPGSSSLPEVCMTYRVLASEFEGYCTLDCPDDVSVGTGPNASDCGVAVTYTTPSTTGNCGAVTCTPASGEVFPVGTTTVNCSTESLFTCSFTVTVTDTTAPAVTCPAPIAITLTSGCVAAIPDVVALSSATDNCTPSGSLVLTQSPAAGTMVGPGVHPITFSAVDGLNNIGSCTTTFTVIDGQPPAITGPDPAIYLATSTGPSGVAVTFPTPTATDNCSSVTVTTNPTSGAVFSNGKTLVTATAVDSAGLEASTQFVVKVVRFGESIGVYIPSTAAWFLRNTNSNGSADLTFTFGPGGDGWLPVAGDWDRNGTDTAGLFYNPDAGVFLSDTNGPGGANYVFTYGPSGSGWIPIAGDWNGEGVDTIGLYDPSTGNFFLKNINAAGYADVILQLGPGNAGFLPIVGDWNGDGIDTVGIYSPETGVFFLKNTNTSGPADLTFTFGASGKGYLPVSGDWNADNVCTIGLYDPATGNFWLRNSNDDGGADVELTFGPTEEAAIPVVGNWDGDIP